MIWPPAGLQASADDHLRTRVAQRGDLFLADERYDEASASTTRIFSSAVDRLATGGEAIRRRWRG